ncbi:hypothetical protein [Streptomyces sp. NBC_01244]|uniref:hypothetical protein n=1 Tax=Streptomyces sp. NBC_01244 TaxID=2903797 RepID=UPI002E0E3CAA|nr:hypothetical protein OG247_18250 [Streptomyces sp. NBC_01244]
MLYFKAVRRWWTIPAAVVLLTIICWAAGSTEVPVPSFLGGVASVRVKYFAPLLVVITTMYCLDRRLPAAESTAVTRIHWLDHIAVVATVFLTVLTGLVAGMDVPRNLMVLLALALLIRGVANEAAAGGACLLLLLGTAVLGRAYEASGQPGARWWALLLYPPASVVSWVLAAIFLAAGLLAPGRMKQGLDVR